MFLFTFSELQIKCPPNSKPHNLCINIIHCIDTSFILIFFCSEVASRNSGLEALLSCLHIGDPEVDLITVGGLIALTNLATEETTRSKVLHVITAKLLIPTLNSKLVYYLL